MQDVELLKKIAEDVGALKEKLNRVESLLEMIYPDERLIKREFIERVKKAEKRIEDEGLEFSSMDKFLESVEQ